MNLKELTQQINKTYSAKQGVADRLPILVGDTHESNCVVAYVRIDKATKYRGTHIRIAESLDVLINELYYNYDLSGDELLDCIIPIAGFTIIDLTQKLS